MRKVEATALAADTNDTLALASEQAEDFAQHIWEELRRHGGSMMANLLFEARPCLRKRLGDCKLLVFVRGFPNLFRVESGSKGGHQISCVFSEGTTCYFRDRNHVSAPSRSNADAVNGIVRISRGESVGLTTDRDTSLRGTNLPALPYDARGSTDLRSLAKHLHADQVERVVHALRQLERYLTVRLRKECVHGRDASDVSFFLRDRKLRRKVEALSRVLPFPELFVQDDRTSKSEADELSTVASSSWRWRCPQTAFARLLAGYLLRFLGDRPDRFTLRESKVWRETPLEARVCTFGDFGETVCPCQYEVALVSMAREGNSLEAGSLASLSPEICEKEDIEAILFAVARRIRTLERSGRGSRVPLPRIGRDKEVRVALGGQSLLRLLEMDIDSRVALGLRPRFHVVGVGFFTVAVMGTWDLELEHSVDASGAEAPQAVLRPPPTRPQRNDLRVDILHEGAGVVAIFKPPGRTSDACLQALQAHYDSLDPSLGEGRKIICVSRLDRDTSGVLVAATSQAAADCLTDQFKRRVVSKRYVALCVGRLSPREGAVSAKLFISGFGEKWRAYVSPKGKEACTQYQVLRYLCRGAPQARASACTLPSVSSLADSCASDELSEPLRVYSRRKKVSLHYDAVDVSVAKDVEEHFSLLVCAPVTGRTHQIRAHLAWLGHPLVADANYNPRGQARLHFHWCPRLFLHCLALRLRDVNGSIAEIVAPLSRDLSNVLEEQLQTQDGRLLGSFSAQGLQDFVVRSLDDKVKTGKTERDGPHVNR
eukprot:TRINITY_DN31175_c0_g1_i1.p1 TRINITY_DN31175_c0_g1~~TRINITY_DN31175_c0_g1_i1.p1  ORF type:complete len:770 (+),score=89.22 TRINITY_DN31175_c0_g1_i1:65-2374(+)